MNVSDLKQETENSANLNKFTSLRHGDRIELFLQATWAEFTYLRPAEDDEIERLLDESGSYKWMGWLCSSGTLAQPTPALVEVSAQEQVWIHTVGPDGITTDFVKDVR
jgi:hypothetical protein